MLIPSQQIGSYAVAGKNVERLSREQLRKQGNNYDHPERTNASVLVTRRRLSSKIINLINTDSSRLIERLKLAFYHFRILIAQIVWG